MAVYTQLSHAEIADFLTLYNVGELVDFKPIAEGVSNTNYLLISNYKLQTTNYILTLFEQNFKASDLPFFMDLTEHLAGQGIPCPQPIHSKNNQIIAEIKNKPAVLIEFLDGKGNNEITPQHLELLGEMVAKLHIATADFKKTRPNSLSIKTFPYLFAGFRGRADEIMLGLEHEIATELDFLQKNYPKNLPSGVVHTDLFPDNVFFSNPQPPTPNPLFISGIIDFYFSCTDFYIYDLLIVLNAWCFDANHEFVPELANSLFAAYNKIRPITDAEMVAMPILARAAAMRFLLTRMDAWLNRTDGALVTPKDPLEYVKKLRFYKEHDIGSLLSL